MPGRLHGAANFQASPFGQALACDGKTGFVEIPHHPTMDVAKGPFTIAAWIRPREIRQSGIVCLGGYGYTNGWLLDIPYDEGQLRIETATSQNEPNGTVQSEPGILKANQWMHVAAVVERGNEKTRLFVNGFEVAQGSVLWSSLSNPTRSLFIGRIHDAHRFSGDIDEVWFFRRALSKPELEMLVEPGRSMATRPIASPQRLSEGPSTDRFAELSKEISKAKWDADNGFELAAGDTAVFVGQTDMVRSCKEGSLEALLSGRFASTLPRFRSMAWEGDTVWEQWRDLNFGSWESQLRSVNASVILAQYGQLEALQGTEQISEFIEAYESLLDEFETQTQRIVLFSPHPFGPPVSVHAPDLTAHNADVRAYTRAIQQLAERRGYLFVALDELSAEAGLATSNGMHLTNESHRVVAEHVFRALQLGEPNLADTSDMPALRRAIAEKNRLWFDNWRPMNWSFAFGDRTQQPFGTPSGGKPALRVELKDFKPLIDAADRQIGYRLLGQREDQPGLPPTEEHSIRAKTEPDAETTTGALSPTDGAVEEEYDHSPESELASFRLTDGFDVNLFASEQDGVIKPLQMRWDDRGRLWVLCAPTYPHIDPGAEPGDYILVCEDTDGDGRADKFNKFADGLFMPMGIEFGDGGVYLCEATELIHLRDTDGDGVADQRRVVMSGFGTADAHQMINSLTWGPEGSLFFSQGHHAYSHVETPWGIAKLHKSGIWRYRPRSNRLDGFFNLSSAGLNCQGITYDDWGQVFHNSAAWSGGFYTVPGMMRTLRDAPYMALAVPDRRNTGIEFIQTQHMPESLQGAVAWGGFMSNAIQLHRIVPQESGYYAEVLPDLMTSDREEFRPVNVRVGPDGGLYVCDWYNAIIGHYQASYRDPRRDRTRGRIWRITARGRPTVTPTNLDGSTVPELLDQLRSSEGLVRYNAKRRLFDMPSDDVVPIVERWLESLDPDDPLYSQLQIRGLGILQAHESVSVKVMQTLLTAEEPRTRAYAVHAIGQWIDGHDSRIGQMSETQTAGAVQQALTWLSEAIEDEQPNVRLAAIVACSYVPSPRSIVVAARMLDHPRDRYLDYAFYQCVAALKPHWYPAMMRGELGFEGRLDHIHSILELDGSSDVALLVKRLWQSPDVRPEQKEDLFDLLLSVGDDADLETALDFAMARPTLLSSFVELANSRGKRPGGELKERVAELLRGPRSETRTVALRLAGAWELSELDSLVSRIAFSQEATPAETAAGLQAIAALRGAQAVELLKTYARPARGVDVQAAALQALSDINLETSAEAAVELLNQQLNSTDTQALLAPFLARQQGASILAKQLGPVDLDRDAAIQIHRVLSTLGRDERELIEIINEKIGVQTQTREYDARLVQELVREIEESGDVQHGRDVYYSKLGNCAACHKIDSRGGDLGPDLSIIGKGRSTEQLLESVLWPNRQVREGYMSTRVLCDDGRIYQGYRTRETKDMLYLREVSSGEIVAIAQDKIERTSDAGSIMPENLTDTMRRDDLRDLIRFLSELGR